MGVRERRTSNSARRRGSRLWAFGALIALAAAGVVTAPLAFPPALANQGMPVPFDPNEPGTYIALNTVGATPTSTQLTIAQVDATGEMTYNQSGTATDNIQYNAVAFNPADGFLYATIIAPTTPTNYRNRVIRIGQNNIWEPVFMPDGVTWLTLDPVNVGATQAYTAATFDDAGNYWATTPGGGTTWVRSFDILSPARSGTATQQVSLVAPTPPPFVNTFPGYDLIWAHGYLWTMTGAGLKRIHPTTGQITLVVPPGTNYWSGVQFGAQWVYGNGNFGWTPNNTMTSYQYAITDPTGAAPTLELIAAAPSAITVPAGWSNQDAASDPRAEIDLGVTKTFTPATATVGDPVAFTLTVANHSATATSEGSVILDDIPAWFSATTIPTGCTLAGSRLTCVVGALAPGASAAFTVAGTVASDPPGACGENTATVIGNQADPNSANNSLTARLCPRTLEVTKTAALVTDGAGSPRIDYTVTATNPGPTGYDTVDPAVLIDYLSAAAPFVYADDAAWTYSGASDPNDASATYNAASAELTWTGPLAAGETVTITYSVAPPTATSVRTALTLTNTACADTAESEMCAATTTQIAAPGLPATGAVGEAPAGALWAAGFALLALGSILALRRMRVRRD